jgi:hypothetical protein
LVRVFLDAIAFSLIGKLTAAKIRVASREEVARTSPRQAGELGSTDASRE